MLTEETKSVHFGTLKFDHLPRPAVPIFQLFSKLQKRSRVVSGGKCEKSNKWNHFLSLKTLKYIFLEMKTVGLRQIDVTEHHFLDSTTQELQGTTCAAV